MSSRKNLTWQERQERAKQRLQQAATATLHWEMGLLVDPPTAEQRRLMYPELPSGNHGPCTPIPSHHFCIYDAEHAHLAFA
jgi:hypothetical protein